MERPDGDAMSDEERLEFLRRVQIELAGQLEPRFRARVRANERSAVRYAFLRATIRQTQHLSLLIRARFEEQLDSPVEGFALVGRMFFEIRQAVHLFEKRPEYYERFKRSWYNDAARILRAYDRFLEDDPEIAAMLAALSELAAKDGATIEERWPRTYDIAEAAEEMQEYDRFFASLSMLMHPSPWFVLPVSLSEAFDQRRPIAAVATKHLVEIRNHFRRWEADDSTAG